MPREPEYRSIARTLRAEVLAGTYDEDGSLPGNAAIADRFDVNLKTAGRAIQELVSQRLLIPRPGQRPVVVPPEQRVTPWPMTGRYARARVGGGLVFATDLTGDIRKDTVRREWVRATPAIAHLLHVNVGGRVFHRATRTYIDGKLAENTALYFPAQVIAKVPELESEERIQVVPMLENAGYVIARTANEVRARHANKSERDLFDLMQHDVVFEQVHGTYGAEDEALEAVINVRPAADNVITFETYEGP